MNIDENFFNAKTAKQNPETIDEILTKNEKVLFRSKPKKSAHIAEAFFNMLPFVIIWLLFDGFAIFMIISNGIGENAPGPFTIFIIGFFMLHLMPVWIWIYGIIKATAGYKNIEYVFTDKRIIIREGIFKLQFVVIKYNTIKKLDLKKSFSDKLIGVGDIEIKYNDNQSAMIYDIENPAFILNKLREITSESKLQIEYPSQIKPETTEEKLQNKHKVQLYKCPNCGANRRKGEDECTYCGYNYPKY
ncbi:MAG: PH domain-containing protein [Clostridia bacterium]|nr:PH domain-containing protein [Clostridia bacterium]